MRSRMHPATHRSRANTRDLMKIISSRISWRFSFLSLQVLDSVCPVSLWTPATAISPSSCDDGLSLGESRPLIFFARVNSPARGLTRCENHSLHPLLYLIVLAGDVTAGAQCDVTRPSMPGHESFASFPSSSFCFSSFSFIGTSRVDGS